MRRVLWQRLDLPGSEWCEWEDAASGSALRGVALVSVGDEPWRIDYAIELDARDRTRNVVVAARGPAGNRGLELSANGRGAWTANGRVLAELEGCLDLDLGFSPAGTALALARLGLGIGETADVDIACVTFPGLEVRRTRQAYRRVGEDRYACRSQASEAELELDADSLVRTSGGFWRAVRRGRSHAA